MSFRYPRNVSFQCRTCALCCGDTKARTRRIRLVKPEAERISQATLTSIEEFAVRAKDCAPYVYEIRKKVESGTCIFLLENRCTIYAIRPLICRFYPFELRTEKGKHEFSYTDECPGIARGKFHMLKKSYFDQLYLLACDLLDENLKV